jgi:mannosyltransferase
MADDIARRHGNVLLALILVLATILRLVRLGSQSFSYDEVYSAILSAKSLAVVATRFGQTPTLFHILLHFWLHLGRSDAMIRLLPLLFGIASLWVVYLLGKKLMDVRHGLLCSFLLAISPFHIWYSQDARMYSLLILLSTASTLFFVKFLQEKSGWPKIWWVVTTGLAIYTHYYATFLLFCQGAFFFLFLNKYRPLMRRFGYSLGIMVVVILPIFFLYFSVGRHGVLLAEGAGGNPLQIFSLPYTFFAFSLGYSYGPSVAELHWLTSLAALRPYLIQLVPAALLFSVIFALGLRSLWRERERLVFILLYLMVPIAGGCLVSLVWPQISYNVRYISIALPPYGLILTRGLLAPRNRTIRWVLTGLVVVVTLYSVHNYYYQDKYAKARYRWAAQYVSTHAEEGDIILAAPLKPFTYYYPGPLTVHTALWSPTFYRKMIAARIRGSQRAWLVMGREWDRDPEGKMKSYMNSKFPTVIETTYTNLYMGLFDMTSNHGD